MSAIIRDIPITLILHGAAIIGIRYIIPIIALYFTGSIGPISVTGIASIMPVMKEITTGEDMIMPGAEDMITGITTDTSFNKQMRNGVAYFPLHFSL
jgi:hypothetical protein